MGRKKRDNDVTAFLSSGGRWRSQGDDNSTRGSNSVTAKSAATSTFAMPSLDECKGALSQLLASAGTGISSSSPLLADWSGIVQRCLSYGTGCNDRLLRREGDSIETAEEARAEEAGRVLVDALGWYLAGGGGGEEQPKDATTATEIDRIEDGALNATASWVSDSGGGTGEDPAVRVVIEALWLIGCLLESSSDDGETGDNPLTPYRRLLIIIRHLTTTPRSEKDVVARANEGGKDDSMEVDNAESSGRFNEVSPKPLILVSSLQATLELPLLEAAGLLPRPALGARPKKAPPLPKGPKGKVSASSENDGPAVLVQKKLKKMNTDMYYRQHKFNLLAEESEGYAKLLSCFLAGPGDVAGLLVKEEHEAAKKYVRALIGAFDIDPNRALDLALDALEWELNEVVNRSLIEVAGAKASFAELSRLGNEDRLSWWGLERLSSAMASKNAANGAGAILSLLAIIRDLDGDAERNGYYRGRAIAHLLGFKYRSFRELAASSKQGLTEGTGSNIGAADPLRWAYPKSLHLLAAFLCVHGALDPHALLPHLAPSCDAASAAALAASKATSRDGCAEATDLVRAYRTYCEDTVKRLKKLGVVSLNSSPKSSDKKDEAKKNDANPGTKESFNGDPAVGLFRALLAVGGDWDAATEFLAHAAVPGFASLVQSSGNVENNCPVDSGLRSAMGLAAVAACTLSQGVASDVCAWVTSLVDSAFEERRSVNGKGDTKRKRNGEIKSSALLPPSSSESVRFTITMGSSLAEISSALRDPLSCLARSGAIRRNQNLYTRLCRLYASKLAAETFSSSKGNSDEIETWPIDDDTVMVLSTFLVPSLSLFPPDTGLPAELWSALKVLPYTLRYRLYSGWRGPGLEKGALRVLSPSVVKSGIIPKPLDVIESEIETGTAARYVLKRISKENVSEMGRRLARTSHANPLVVFSDMLGKIESYDNMILMMVDALQFANELGLDVVGYCLLASLGGGDYDSGVGAKGRTKVMGLNTEQWLASLETFTGAFYKKFPHVEMRGILVYLTKRFKECDASELGVLRSLIKTAGGYGYVDYDSIASLSDLQLDGRRGSRLLKRETSSFGVVEDVSRNASRRLRSVLQQDDLGAIILLLLSQIRSKILYSKISDATKEHIKVIGSLYDNCQRSLCLLLDYLSDSSDDLDAKEKFASSMPLLLDLHAKYGVDTAVAWMLCRPLIRKAMFHADVSAEGKSSPGEPPAYLAPFTPSSSKMAGSYKSMLPETAWRTITPMMFELFYSLSVYDISCPEERYKVDIDRLKKDCERLAQLQKGGEAARSQMEVLAAVAAAAGGTYDEIRQATAFTKEHAEELDRSKRNVDQLSRDLQQQLKRCKSVLSKLEAQKEFLITSNNEEEGMNNSAFAREFMTHCIYPRCFLSPEDSLFCASFVKLLHKIKVPGFMTIELIDYIVNAITGSFYCMTEDEAGNCAIFFNEIWKWTNSWRYDNDSFATELKDTPGSRLSKIFAQENGIEDHSSSSGITHNDYKSIYSQWHQKIGSAAIGCLKSSEYMHTRAALIVLSRTVLVFPTQPKTGDDILKTLVPLQSDDCERLDIRATAQGYRSQLMKARDEGMWKEENMAVTKARQEREKMKAEERKKKLAQQHEDIKKESERISSQLGYGRIGWRPERDGRQWGTDQRMHSRGPPLNPGAPTFTPKSGESRELHGRMTDSRRQGLDREMWERDRGGRQPDIRDSRWQGGESNRGERRKRSRSPEPGEDTERQKRPRGDRTDWQPHHRDQPGPDQQQSNRGGGARRSRY